MSAFNDFINPLILFPLLSLAALIYYLCPMRFRWVITLAFSLAFYFWMGSWAVVILAVSISGNYLLGISIQKNQGKAVNFPLLAGIFLNLGLWIAFKYGTNPLSTVQSSSSNTVYLLGASFFTLQNIGYLVDISKKLIPAERDPFIFASFVAFFPKIAAGPIERGKSLMPQFREKHRFEWENITWGVRQIAFGLFKKLVLANRLAVVADEVFNHPGGYGGLALILGILSFAFQLYFDFSGYSDIALGIARIFGFRLTVNFKLPYLAEDVVEFWNRWHISLSTWLRDYIFYPTRRFMLRHAKNAVLLAAVIPPLLTMLASGFWHGTGWTFILWGLYHAFLYIAVILRKKYLGVETWLQKEWLKYPKIAVNFAFITLGWILFRAASIRDAAIIFHNIFLRSISLWPLYESVGRRDTYLALIILITAFAGGILLLIKPVKIDEMPAAVRWGIYFMVLAAVSILGVFQASANPFVYFRF